MITDTLEFPEPLNALFKKAIKYEWISFLYMLSASTFSFLAMSNSQTMKTIWLEDLLGILPPLSFLIASKIVKWNPTKNFPYGFHKITSMAFLSSSLALFILGVYLFIDSTFVLLTQDHPTIPSIHIGTYTFWLGYLMIITLLWSSVPSTLLGHLKIPLACKLYDKILYADSKMNKASWMSGFASIFGILGIGLGFWWADATIGMLISLSILNDGYENLKQSLLDLLDEIPKTIGRTQTDPLIKKTQVLIKQEEWVLSSTIRFRDEGHVFFGEIFITPKKEVISTKKITLLQTKIKKLHWRLHDIVITIIPKENP